jgi:hypothetical protein
MDLFLTLQINKIPANLGKFKEVVFTGSRQPKPLLASISFPKKAEQKKA